MSAAEFTRNQWSSDEPHPFRPVYGPSHFLGLADAACDICGEPEDAHEDDERELCGLCGMREPRAGLTACRECAG